MTVCSTIEQASRFGDTFLFQNVGSQRNQHHHRQNTQPRISGATWVKNTHDCRSHIATDCPKHPILPNLLTWITTTMVTHSVADIKRFLNGTHVGSRIYHHD